LAKLINSNKLRAGSSKLKEVLPPQLEAAARAGMRTHGAGVCQFQNVDPRQFVLYARERKDYYTTATNRGKR